MWWCREQPREEFTLARPNHQFEKRQRELAKQKKKEEKRQRKLERTSGAIKEEAADGAESVDSEGDTE